MQARRDTGRLDWVLLASALYLCSPLLVPLGTGSLFGGSLNSAADALTSKSLAFLGDEATFGHDSYLSATDHAGLPLPLSQSDSLPRVEMRPFLSGQLNAQRTWFSEPRTRFHSTAFSSVFDVDGVEPVQSTRIARTVALAPAYRRPPRASRSRRGSNLFFLYATSPERAIQQSEYWRHYLYWGPGSTNVTRHPDDTLEDDRRGPGCLVADNSEMRSIAGIAKELDPQRPAMLNAQITFDDLKLSCTMSPGLREASVYDDRKRFGAAFGATTSRETVLSLVLLGWKAAHEEQRQTEWFLILDDDTFMVDPHNLIDSLSDFDPDQDWLLGGYSEAERQQYRFGHIAYGGGGIIISRGLMQKMYDSYDQCRSEDAIIRERQGDGKITYCAAVAMEQIGEYNRLYGVRSRLAEPATQTGSNNVVTPLEGLNQMDLGADSSGFFRAACDHITALPFASEYQNPAVRTVALRLLAASAWALGGSNLFRRSVFDDGKVVVVQGYSITVYAKPLTAEDLDKTEWTYQPKMEPYRPHRPGLKEGTDKLTYYLSYVVIEDDDTHQQQLLLSQTQQRSIRRVRLGYKCTTNLTDYSERPVASDIETIMFLPLID
ncbi:hypothetical protein E5Q_03584 [Mixia osmundae IAM 14324]|uniref:Fringe-like glycosyltransferase domain-containing protein n=1 Tax=Mixia osmundae (strain CBS 9802 / IAM 14324 / JCM 22182 / KY 12970) TaxID=764103 RepID=G7E250_MIXOS|nr:hypothetical protein E5Q_03584 [Mixia osmundae IAM 14324]